MRHSELILTDEIYEAFEVIKERYWSIGKVKTGYALEGYEFGYNFLAHENILLNLVKYEDLDVTFYISRNGLPMSHLYVVPVTRNTLNPELMYPSHEQLRLIFMDKVLHLDAVCIEVTPKISPGVMRKFIIEYPEILVNSLNTLYGSYFQTGDTES